jgi:hypothetical protein
VESGSSSNGVQLLGRCPTAHGILDRSYLRYTWRYDRGDWIQLRSRGDTTRNWREVRGSVRKSELTYPVVYATVDYTTWFRR